LKARNRNAFRFAPWLAVSLFLGPVIAGLLGTAVPAFSVGVSWPTLEPWRILLAAPELGSAVALSAGSSVLGTLGALVASVAVLAALHARPVFLLIRAALLPLVAIPHLGLATGLAFLLSPSGWLTRLAAPLLGWTQPPDLALVQDPWGLCLALGLAVKEMPFLCLALLAAANQVRAEQQLRAARSLGYGPASAWMKVLLPQLYPQIRLPILAVLAYGLSVVDVAVVLGPASPPPLAPLLWRWFNDPGLTLRGPAAAGSLLLAVLLFALVLLWRLGEFAVARMVRPWLTAGACIRTERWYGLGGWLAAGVSLGLGAMAFLMLLIWSVAGRWPFPRLVPLTVDLEAWVRLLPTLLNPLLSTAGIALLVGLTALGIVIACLEHEALSGLRPTGRVLGLAYLPLLVPQVSFLFGFAVLLAHIGIDGSVLAVSWSHLVFVLPYVLLMLRDPWLALDPRYARAARALGKGEGAVLWRVKLPLLLRPVLLALAVGVAVSVAQYLATLFAGGGRVSTLALETLALAASGDRRRAALAALLMALLPLVALGFAGVIPRVLLRRRATP
jgi:putative thiamine transport system permease protein